jgi:hypothetical protein
LGGKIASEKCTSAMKEVEHSSIIEEEEVKR